MVPQTETKSSAGFKAGVKDYRLTYYPPDYVVRETKEIVYCCIAPVSATRIFSPGSTLPLGKTPISKNRWGGVTAIDATFEGVKKVQSVHYSRMPTYPTGTLLPFNPKSAGVVPTTGVASQPLTLAQPGRSKVTPADYQQGLKGSKGVTPADNQQGFGRVVGSNFLKCQKVSSPARYLTLGKVTGPLVSYKREVKVKALHERSSIADGHPFTSAAKDIGLDLTKYQENKLPHLPLPTNLPLPSNAIGTWLVPTYGSKGSQGSKERIVSRGELGKDIQPLKTKKLGLGGFIYLSLLMTGAYFTMASKANAMQGDPRFSGPVPAMVVSPSQNNNEKCVTSKQSMSEEPPQSSQLTFKTSEIEASKCAHGLLTGLLSRSGVAPLSSGAMTQHDDKMLGHSPSRKRSRNDAHVTDYSAPPGSATASNLHKSFYGLFPADMRANLREIMSTGCNEQLYALIANSRDEIAQLLVSSLGISHLERFDMLLAPKAPITANLRSRVNDSHQAANTFLLKTRKKGTLVAELSTENEALIWSAYDTYAIDEREVGDRLVQQYKNQLYGDKTSIRHVVQSVARGELRPAQMDLSLVQKLNKTPNTSFFSVELINEDKGVQSIRHERNMDFNTYIYDKSNKIDKQTLADPAYEDSRRIMKLKIDGGMSLSEAKAYVQAHRLVKIAAATSLSSVPSVQMQFALPTFISSSAKDKDFGLAHTSTGLETAWTSPPPALPKVEARGSGTSYQTLITNQTSPQKLLTYSSDTKNLPNTSNTPNTPPKNDGA